MRFWRIEDMDVYDTEPPPVRDTELRSLVDGLPPLEKHILERTFFGGATLSDAAREVGISTDRAKRIRTRALGRLRVQMP